MANNNFPQTALSLPSGIKTLNKDPRTSTGSGYFPLDSISVDFRIQGFVTDQTTNDHINAFKKNGVKFIISDPTAAQSLTSITDSYSTDDYGALSQHDVLVWNSVTGVWELWYDASNAGISGASGGAFGFVVEEENFYGYFGSVNGWDTVGVGNTGPDGDTGPAGVFGRKYTQIDIAASPFLPDDAGELYIQNTVTGTYRLLWINRYSGGLQGFGGATGDLASIFYPNGIDAAYDDTNPTVFVSLYNSTRNRTYAFRASARASAYSSSNQYIQFDGDTVGSQLNSFELITDDSGTGNWTGENVWQADDEIYVVAVADGVNGVTGADGVTGQGITYYGEDVDGFLQIQYINSDGSLSDPVSTGIVSGEDGGTGDPGEVGFLMAATGASASTDYWGNNIDGATEDVAFGEIYYTNYNDEKLIALSYDAVEAASTGVNDQVPFALGFNASQIVSGTDYLNKPGTLYFYEQIGLELKLKSFIKYSQARTTGLSDSLVILKGIEDTLTTFNPTQDETRLGITLAIGQTKNLYVLPSPQGIKGVGITFGAVINNALYLDYIDENGVTFGRFRSVEGITGPQGSLNPFNIPFVGITDGIGFSNTNIQVVARNSGATATQLKVSTESADSDDVTGYLQAPLQTDSKSGFLSVFDTGDIANYGIFRFRDGIIDPGNAHVIYGTGAKPLIHVAGNITNIIDDADSTKGFASGERLLFALNTDGPRGFSGAVGIGFTYGNEYFATNINNKPEVRSDGNPLEIGDKWYCLDAGLEFTYLGTSADGIVEVDTGGGSGDRVDIWVQTNNARQGRQGPKGDRGLQGVPGTDGATGINDAGAWLAGSYDERDSVFVTFNAAYNAAPSTTEKGRVLTNWTALGAGVTNGYFTVKPGTGSTNQIPGNFPSSGGSPSVWVSSQSTWSPVVVNKGGTQGAQGDRGNTGASITDVNAVAEPGEYNVFLDVTVTPEEGDPVIIRVQNDSGEDVNFRGPTGPAGELDAIENQFLVANGSSTIDGTDTIVLNNGRAELRNYREQVSTSGGVSVASNELTIDCDTPVHYHTFGNDTINTVNLANCDNIGDGVTVYIKKPAGNTVTWNANQASEYKFGGSSVSEVFVSSQGYPTQGKIEFADTADQCIGAFTFKRITGTSTPTLVVNYVLFVLPE